MGYVRGPVWPQGLFGATKRHFAENDLTLPLTLFGELQKDILLKMTLPLKLFGELRTVLTVETLTN